MTMSDEEKKRLLDFVNVANNEGGIALLKEIEGQEVDKDQLIAVLANELHVYRAGYLRALAISKRQEALIGKIFDPLRTQKRLGAEFEVAIFSDLESLYEA